MYVCMYVDLGIDGKTSFNFWNW